jgi:excisionase family DNA binding protein
MPPLFYATGQVARQLGTTLAAVRVLCENGVIAAETTVGGHWRVPASEVERLKRDGLPPIPRPMPLAQLLDTLPIGRRRVGIALVDDEAGRTYPEVAAILGIRLGTVHQHLRRIRLRHPAAYSALMKLRARQLRARHRRALARARAHSKRWHTLVKRRRVPNSDW